jgi:hypothetical protein
VKRDVQGTLTAEADRQTLNQRLKTTNIRVGARAISATGSPIPEKKYRKK